DIPNRLKRHFFIFNMVLPNEQSVQDIYGTITREFFAQKTKDSNGKIIQFIPALKEQSKKLPKLTAELLKKMSAKFQPTPIKFHYFYNMRELSRTFQGLFQADKDSLNRAQDLYQIPPETFLICLWKHEVTRVFCDKLREVEDIKEFNNIVDSVLSDNFEKEALDILKTDVYFADFLRKPEVNEEFGCMEYKKYYENIKEMKIARDAATTYMQELNQSKEKHVEIVLFDDCLKNLMRITRVIQQDMGSCMLVGVGGSGKQSLTRLAAAVSQMKTTQPVYACKFGFI
ncbi:MAG: hypothetical protein MJ252_07215, partial [archaeon]|nr:hypothetical protein [archaeon]